MSQYQGVIPSLTYKQYLGVVAGVSDAYQIIAILEKSISNFSAEPNLVEGDLSA